jgi:hypothetical protein
MMTDITGAPLPLGPNGTPVVLMPLRCRKCGAYQFKVSEGRSRIYIPGRGRIS